MSRVTPELLAPAGGPEALRAAVAAGADAVYLGVDRLNARRGAENFTTQTLAEACRFAHLRGVGVYLTANVIVLPSEMASALELVADAWVAGVDAVIVQDLGLIRAIRRVMPEVRLHASTQINTHSTATAVALGELGVARVTLARETTVQQIAAIAEGAGAAGIETESFVHGALCVCYSGQCLLSSLIGGRSANRGMCAQPCRLSYELVDATGAVRDTPGSHLLSPKDLAGIGVLPELVEAGVASIKIEGRMKSADYVALVTGVYRTALDRAAASSETYTVREGEMSVLSEAFSRGFSEAYLVGERGNHMMSYQRPNNRGVPVGRVVSVDGQMATIAIDTALAREDTIEFWTGRGRFAQPAMELAIDRSPVETAPARSRVTVRLQEPATAGDRVFRVRNAALADAVARTYSDPGGRRLPVDVAVRLEIGSPLEVTLTDDVGRQGVAMGSVVESARTRPVEAADVIEHVGRFGSTPFEPRSWDVALSPGAGIGFSELHRVRREAAEALEAAILAPWSGRGAPAISLPQASIAASPRPTRISLVAVVANVDAVDAALAAGADRVDIAGAALIGSPRSDLAVVLPRVCHDGEEDAAVARGAGAATAVAGTLGQLARLASAGTLTEAHWSLNAVNGLAVDALASLGATFAWLSPELTHTQVFEVARESRIPVGIAVAGRQELMVTEHCVLMAAGDCPRTCRSCTRRQGSWSLRDRKGYEFPVRTDESGRTHIYNAVPLDLTHAMGDVLATGVSAVRVDVESESVDVIQATVRRVRNALDAALAGAAPEPRPSSRSAVTSGHFYRGVT